jgi:hypothetical protein
MCLSIIEQFEPVARRQRGRIAIRDADTALTFGELCAADLAGTRGRNPTRLRRDRSADDAVVRGRRVQA